MGVNKIGKVGPLLSVASHTLYFTGILQKKIFEKIKFRRGLVKIDAARRYA